MLKLKVMYEVIREATIEVPDEVVKELDFQAMWDKLHEADPSCENLEGNILVVADADTHEEYYC